MSFMCSDWFVSFKGKRLSKDFEQYRDALDFAKKIAKKKSYSYSYTGFLFGNKVVNELPNDWDTLSIVKMADFGGGEYPMKSYTYKRSTLER